MKKLLVLLLLPLCVYGAGSTASSYTASGTAGTGFLQVATQSSAPSTPTTAIRLYANSGNDLAWKEAGGFVGVVDLGGASRTITLSGSPTLGDWFDQAVKAASSPSFNRITSTVATGTSPLVVASTTVVANLNASLLGGATFAAPGPIGSGTPGSGAFTTLSATGQITSTLATGTSPFVVASTTVVANLNAAALSGATFAAPGAIGGGTPGSGAFTTLSATGLFNISGASAGQIQFPASQNASANVNTLDDYEEGTFTPALEFGGAAVGMTYGSPRVGTYTKIGNTVFYRIAFTLTAKGSSTGAATITGFPFTSINDGLYTPGSTFISALASITGQIMARVITGATRMDLYQVAASTYSGLTEANFTDTGQMLISGFYIVP